MSDFNPALPKNITWRVGKNKGQDADKKPNRCTLFIPAESMQALVSHLMAMVDTATNATTGEVYDWETKQKVTVPGYYLTGKGIGNESNDWAVGELALALIQDVVSPPVQAVAPPAPTAPPVAPPAPPVPAVAPPMPAIPTPSGF